MKGGILLSATGYIQVRAYASRAVIPIAGATIAVRTPQGDLIAARLTNRSGMLDEPIAISVPDLQAGLEPGTGVIPYALVSIHARAENYEQIEAENVQVFPDTVTTQNLELIPLAEFPQQWNRAEIFNTPPQNL